MLVPEPMADATSAADHGTEEPRPSRLVALGAVLLSGIVAWKLLGSTYTADVRAICEAEQRSGFTLQRDMARVTLWARANLSTADGNQLFSSLRDAELAARAERLRSEASALRLGVCPLVESYQRLAADAEFRSDIQQLCSWASFPGLADLDDDARLATLSDWIDTRAKSARTKPLADALRRAPPAERAGVLRALASKNEVFSCDLAKTLDVPLPP